jgi:hypothetical protein
VLDSTADEQNTRRLAVRAEQIFTSYRQILPPRREAVQPLRLIVLGSMDEYHALLPKLGLKAKIDNPACYAEDRNTVVVGSDLTRLAKVTGQVGLQNAELRRDLRDLEERFPDRIRALADNLRKSGASNGEVSRELAKESAKFKRQIEKKREELRKSDQQIEGLFKKNAGQTIVRLYHELFHAYLRNCVYPRRQFDVPPWLNEGLAVIFEGGLLEGDLLRVDAPNPAALRKLKADLAGPEPLGLEDVLAAGEEQFLFTSGAPSAAADRHYVHAWGLAYYLTFERRILGSSELEAYLRAGPAPPAPCQRFQRLIGMPLAQFEQEWRTYIRGLE